MKAINTGKLKCDINLNGGRTDRNMQLANSILKKEPLVPNIVIYKAWRYGKGRNALWEGIH
jgi:hypothetical protein